MALLDVLNSFLGNDNLVCYEMLTHTSIFLFIKVTNDFHAHILCFPELKRL